MKAKEIKSIFENEAEQYPILSSEEETKIAERMRQGDEKAREKLICCNLRHVLSAAREFAFSYEQLNEAVSIGYEAVCKSAHKFDASMGNRFSTFAVTCVKNAIKSELPNAISAVSIPHGQRVLISKLKREINLFWGEHGYEPDAAILANITGIPEKKVRFLLNLELKRENIDAGKGVHNNDIEKIYDSLDDQDDVALNAFTNIAEKRSGKKELTQILDYAVSTLPERDAKIVRMYFGLDSDKGRTFQDIAKMMNLSVEGVRQVVKKSIAKIRNNSFIMEELCA